MNVITLNCNLWPVNCLRSIKFDDHKRCIKLIEFLRNQYNDNVDVICLQEVFGMKWKQEIIDGVKDLFPYYAFSTTPHTWYQFYDSGLLTLSKHEFSNSPQSYAFSDAAGMLNFANKGFLVTEIMNTTLVNVHLQCDEYSRFCYFTDDQHNVRSRQMQQIHDKLLSRKNTYIVGDFNYDISIEVGYKYSDRATSIHHCHRWCSHPFNIQLCDGAIKIGEKNQTRVKVLIDEWLLSDHYPVMCYL